MPEVNSQITDAVTQANVKVVLESPAEAMGMLYQTISNSIGIALENSLTAQQVADTIYQAATAHGVCVLYNGAMPESGLNDQHVIDYLQGIINEHVSQK